MNLMTVIDAAQAGKLYDGVAAALSLPGDAVKSAMAALCPAIARAMQAKAAADADFGDNLSDLLADHADGGVLDEPHAFADGQSQVDGAFLLTSVYGSSDAASAALQPLAPAIPAAKLPQLAALSGVAVVGVMAKAREAGSTVQASTSGSDIVTIIIDSLIRGAVQALLNKYLPRRRRYGDYLGRKRQGSRPSSSPSIGDIFGSILGNVIRRSI